MYCTAVRFRPSPHLKQKPPKGAVFVLRNGVYYAHMKGFIDFIREKGVVGLAVGFILGGAVSKVVSALVTDIINPVLSLALGATGGLKTASLKLGSAEILYGDLISVVVDFLIVAFVVYFGVKLLGFEKLDKPKA